MSAEDHKALIRHYIEEVWNKGNLSVADDLLAPHYRRYSAPTAEPLDASGFSPRSQGHPLLLVSLRMAICL